MPGTITIDKLRNIERLEFSMPDQGVWLLTAGNGGGKTSLLACLRRIKYSNAFPVHFPSSVQSKNLDNYETAKVTYSINGDEVEYAYRGERWAPRPRKNSHLLTNFGYPDVIYVGATADRITPRPEDFKISRARPAHTNVIAAANQIFETTKFNELRTINLTRGGGNSAFLLRVGQNPAHYHSEKHFSLGELCILKLIKQLQTCPNQSLVLIDELEIALHPRAQIELLNYLKRMAAAKHLTIIFSTHSVSLLKVMERKNIIYLERNDQNVITPLIGCFPTYAIGNLTSGEERAPDVVFYVEDEMARALLEPMINYAMQNKFAATNLHPNIKIVPIGTFDSVVNFLTNQHKSMLPPTTKCFAILDADVKNENVTQWTADANLGQLKKFQDLGARLDYFPWTPEVGVITYLQNNRHSAEQRVRAYFSDTQLTISQNIFADLNPALQGGQYRRQCKSVLNTLSTAIAGGINRSVEEVKRGLAEIFITEYYASNRATMLALLAPKLD